MDEDLHRAMAEARGRSVAYADRWRSSGVVSWLDRSFGSGRDAEAVAMGLLSDIGWVGNLLSGPLAQLADDPLFEAPFRCSRDSLRTSAMLYDGPIASISATVLSAAARQSEPGGSVVAPGRLCFTRYVRSGGAVAERWQAGRPDEPFLAASAAPAQPLAPLAIAQGQIVRHDGREAAHRLTGFARDVVTMTILLRDHSVPLVREYAADDGRLIRAATLDDRPARAAMLLRLLRAQERTDAAAAFDGATRDPAFFLRWEAMREWLALDALAALPRLTAMAADDPHPEIRAAAEAMLALVTARRALDAPQGRAVSCPA